MADDDDLVLPWAAGVQVSQGHWSVVLLFGNGPTASRDARAYAAFVNELLRRERNPDPDERDAGPAKLWPVGKGDDND